LCPKQVQVSPETISTGKTQFAPALPKLLRLKNSHGRNDSGDQLRQRHVETRIPRAARRIRDPNESTPGEF
jgi:hypothetical protein